MRRILIPPRIQFDSPPAGRIHALDGLTMGTSWSVRVAVDSSHVPDALRSGIQQQLDLVVREMSHWEADSDLGRFNRAAPDTWQNVPDAFFDVLSYALSVAEDSDGAYDPAAGALVNRWGFGPVNRYNEPGFVAPSGGGALAFNSNARWRQLGFDRIGRRIRQPGGGLQLDLSAVAKGYGVDRVAAWLEGQGLHHYLVEVGGELRGAGAKPDGQPWWVALEQPPLTGQAEADAVLLALHGLAVATSGDYRRSFEHDGTQYSHTIDPRDGRPVRNGVASVTVIHESCMAADALSTALTVLGPEDGMRFAEERHLVARFLVRRDDGMAELTTRGFRDMLE